MSGLEFWDDGRENQHLSRLTEMIPGEVIHEVFGVRETAEEFRQNEGNELHSVLGSPEQDTKLWHLQEHEMSCAVACQEFVAEGLLKDDFSEQKMRNYAAERGWFSDRGTTAGDVGKLLEAMGLDVERAAGCTEEDIRNVLRSGGKVMAAVNNMVLQNPLYAAIPGFEANHMVQVIGIDESGPGNIRVILNDPGVEDGAGISYSLEQFEKAWNTSGHFMVSAYRPEGDRL